MCIGEQQEQREHLITLLDRGTITEDILRNLLSNSFINLGDYIHVLLNYNKK